MMIEGERSHAATACRNHREAVTIDKWRVTRRRLTMPLPHAEIIEDLEANIRKYGGAVGEWCVGTAKDARGAFSQRILPPTCTTAWPTAKPTPARPPARCSITSSP